MQLSVIHEVFEKFAAIALVVLKALKQSESDTHDCSRASMVTHSSPLGSPNAF